MTNRLFIRLALGYLAIVSAQIGAWALFAPQSFFDGFPGMGRAWVAADGPFNEHLVRDVGALNLTLVVLLVATAIRPTRELLTVSALATLVWGIPHLLYHLFNSDGLATSDFVASVGGLVLFVLLAGGLLAAARNNPFASAESAD